MICISAYTANLAAIMTVSASPSLSSSTVQVAMTDDQPTCSYSANPLLDEFDVLFPTMSYTKYASVEDMSEQLRPGGECQAAIVPKATYDIMRVRPSNCNLRVSQNILRARGAGWVVGRHSQCVQLAVEWSLRQLSNNGALEEAFATWLPNAMCNVELSEDGSDSTTRRQLRKVAAVEGPQTTPSSGLSGQLRRMLKGGGSGGGAAAAATGADSGEEGQLAEGVRILDLQDFVGVFLMCAQCIEANNPSHEHTLLVAPLARIFLAVLMTDQMRLQLSRRPLSWGVVTVVIVVWTECSRACGPAVEARCTSYQKSLAACLKARLKSRALHRQAAEEKRKVILEKYGAPPKDLHSPPKETSPGNKVSPWKRLQLMHNVGGAFADSPRKAKSSCFDISHLRVADVDGNVYRLLHQLVELRSEMMEKLDKLDPHAGSGPASPASKGGKKGKIDFNPMRAALLKAADVERAKMAARGEPLPARREPNCKFSGMAQAARGQAKAEMEQQRVKSMANTKPSSLTKATLTAKAASEDTRPLYPIPKASSFSKAEDPGKAKKPSQTKSASFSKGDQVPARAFLASALDYQCDSSRGGSSTDHHRAPSRERSRSRPQTPSGEYSRPHTPSGEGRRRRRTTRRPVDSSSEGEFGLVT